MKTPLRQYGPESGKRKKRGADMLETTKLCDLHQTRKNGSTITFTFGGNAYEMELCPSHTKALTGLMAELIERAHKAPTATTVLAAKNGKTTRNTVARKASKVIRQWARGEGMECAANGRIPDRIVQLYVTRNGMR